MTAELPQTRGPHTDGSVDAPTPLSIWFYSKATNFEWLSNFSDHPIELDGLQWPTVEHYYQAQKFLGNQKLVDAIRGAVSGPIAKKTSQEWPPRPDWFAVRDGVMRRAIRAKFMQHADLRLLLLSTDQAELVHESETDEYWGRLRSGPGGNQLGCLLMQLRIELMQAPSQMPVSPLERGSR